MARELAVQPAYKTRPPPAIELRESRAICRMWFVCVCALSAIRSRPSHPQMPSCRVHTQPAAHTRLIAPPRADLPTRLLDARHRLCREPHATNAPSRPSVALALPARRTATSRRPARAPPPRADEPAADLVFEQDMIVLLWYNGWATFFRAAATGLKSLDRIGFDADAFTAALGGGSALAFTWLVAGLATRVFEREYRYSRPRVMLTWLIGAPAAQLLKTALYGGFRPDAALTDVLMTLVLMLLVRVGEERGDLPSP